MLILACDTSNSACSACLYEDGRVLAQSLLSLGRTHSLTFMPLVHDLMKCSGRGYKELDAFACTVGPGSFTGIRIGVSAVKAMAMVAQKPAVGVSSLAALAFPFFSHKKTLVAAMTDARNRRVFSAAYYEGREVISENARTIDELMELCRTWEEVSGVSGTDILLCGDVSGLYAKEGYFLLRKARTISLFGREVQPASVAALAYGTIREEDGLMDKYPPQALMPVYRAKTSAERMFPEAHKTLPDTKDGSHD
ncbi:MAG: tRNA (adenosine(37)-N6)-threonylcarbamoyltransferase complex dimerization subunit type 1 TsaB [Eubacteriales bacterium]